MRSFIVVILICFFLPNCYGQGNRRREEIPNHPQKVGEAGIAWYTTWKTGLAEAKRTNRPIFFMSAATACRGVSGVF